MMLVEEVIVVADITSGRVKTENKFGNTVDFDAKGLTHSIKADSQFPHLNSILTIASPHYVRSSCTKAHVPVHDSRCRCRFNCLSCGRYSRKTKLRHE